ncbi:unnamed protein product [Cuscuta epithymum]|uniref:Haem-binding uptake Tiki superfamily ChaN domain-containing protein n=1 Tax=Cuscuta epithymum TaxID=186058 RepID=A0AAV0C2H1_9ASTE|nr:unnamed protein product [Cuscuta epithymum]
MESQVFGDLKFKPLHLKVKHTARRFNFPPGNSSRRRDTCHLSFSVRCGPSPTENVEKASTTKRRDVLVTSLLFLGASVIRTAVSRADENPPESNLAGTEAPSPMPAQVDKATEEKKTEEVVNSRIYDATAIGEPLAVGKDKSRVWEKLMSSRIVYLGEAEQVPTRDDKELELEILKSLRKRCEEAQRPISLALEAFPSDLQPQLNDYMAKSIDEETLKAFVSHWPPERWQEYEPILSYCNINGVRLIACGLPLEVQRRVQAEGIHGLSKSDSKKYSPPAGSGFISGFTPRSYRSSIDMNSPPNYSTRFGSQSYLSAQARVVEEYSMSQIILQAIEDDGPSGLLLVVTGGTHVAYGYKGTGLPARVFRTLQQKNQSVILLDPERQEIRREGEVPVADFLWYSAAQPCSRNCFDRAEIARVMNAAGKRRDALPKDLQQGLDLGLVSPEVLQNFFDLEKYPYISELTHGFQGFRERLLADPKFLHRLAIEEAISITTTLLAQYQKRKEKFMEELDYVITDTVRGTVVDFFTVWLPAPTISFLPAANDVNLPESFEALKGLLGSIPDNAFQKSFAGKDWALSHRVASVIVGGLKLASVGFISSIGAVTSSNVLFGIRRAINPTLAKSPQNKRSPVLKTALVYGGFLGISANLRYQIIAGIVEHRISDQFSDQTLFVNMLSFVVRTINSYWGTQQWIDLARFTGLQARKVEGDSPNNAAVECQTTDETYNSDDS